MNKLIILMIVLTLFSFSIFAKTYGEKIKGFRCDFGQDGNHDIYICNHGKVHCDSKGCWMDDQINPVGTSELMPSKLDTRIKRNNRGNVSPKQPIYKR